MGNDNQSESDYEDFFDRLESDVKMVYQANIHLNNQPMCPINTDSDKWPKQQSESVTITQLFAKSNKLSTTPYFTPSASSDSQSTTLEYEQFVDETCTETETGEWTEESLVWKED